jgi:hypothetical protein
LILVGAMGLAADAVFHLAANDMTADGVSAESVTGPPGWADHRTTVERPGLLPHPPVRIA